MNSKPNLVKKTNPSPPIHDVTSSKTNTKKKKTKTTISSNSTFLPQPPSSSSTTTTTSSSNWGAKVVTFQTLSAFTKPYLSASTSTRTSAKDTIQNQNPPPPTKSHVPFKLMIQHIPNLPQADEAYAILQRIQREFEPIIQRRGYSVISITEMCCCSDGCNHFIQEQEQQQRNHKNKKTKTTRIMPHNVLGYNLTTGYRSPHSTTQPKQQQHEIHVRLRHAPPAGSWNHHILFPYVDIAGTMCHELAHCVYSNHDSQFYQLMDEILEEHAHQTSRLWSAMQFHPLNQPFGRTIPSQQEDSTLLSSQSQSPLQSQSQPAPFLGLGHRLGGECESHSQNPYKKQTTRPWTSMTTSSLRHLPPKEAARIAAENRWKERQLVDAHFCLPCHEIIEILQEEEEEEEMEEEQGEEEEEENEKKKKEQQETTNHKVKDEKEQKGNPKETWTRKENVILLQEQSPVRWKNPKPKDPMNNHSTAFHVQPVHHPIIDLTDHDEDEEIDTDHTRYFQPNDSPSRSRDKNHVFVHTMKRKASTIMTRNTCKSKQEEWDRSNEDSSWICPRCTLINRNNSMVVSCDACGERRPHGKNSMEQEMKSISSSLEILPSAKDIVKKEILQSKQDFGGFNIYGNVKQTSRTMDHLT